MNRYSKFYRLFGAVLGAGLFIAALPFYSLPASAGDAKVDARAIAEFEAQKLAHYNMIKAVQKALVSAGYDPSPVDGDRGSRTDAAIIKFQQDSGLAPDGILGPKTMKALGFD